MSAFLTNPVFPSLRHRNHQLRPRRCCRHIPHLRSSTQPISCLASNSENFSAKDASQDVHLNNRDFIVDVDGADDELEFPEDLDLNNIDDDELDLVDIVDQKEVRKRVRKHVEQLAAEIDQQNESIYTSDADTIPPMDQDETAKYVRTAVRAADERKAEDIVALRISKVSYISSFLVIATGNNPPQIRAIANLVEENIGREHGLSPTRVDGVPNSGWILLDYGDFMINIFSPAQRENYNLEALWKRAETMDISDCLTQAPAEPDPVPSAASLDDWLNE